MQRALILGLLVIAPWLGLPGAARAELPPGFTKNSVAGPWDQPVGVAFDENGRMYVWERAGRVWIVENGQKSALPLIDISDEVGNWRDHGLLGFALHPNFLQNGWVYLLYAVDHYHLQHAGSPDYDPSANDYFKPSIARITRYTARASDGFHSVDPTSRRILLGESADSGCPLLYESHGVGSLVFGTDDSLLATCGDGGSFLGPDSGGPEYGAYTVEALAEGIIRPAEDVGAFRAQLVSSLSGKLLRLDPQSGDGLPSNPFYDPANPRAARSRVFALGLRNPFRFTVRPDTGSHDPNDGAPGSLYVGNVGWNTFEEIEVVTPGYNSGWPIYEGLGPHPAYSILHVQNLEAPNPLYGTAGCTQPFFEFTDLLVQETLGTPSFPNPCDPAQQIPASIPRFMHHRPSLAYGRNPDGPMVTPTFTDGMPTAANIGAPGSPVAGTPIGGSTAIGGVWYTGTDFPEEYRDSYFHADYGNYSLTNIHYDENDRPTLVTPFETIAGGIVMLATSPTTGGLYEVDIGGSAVYRVTYVGTADQPPAAHAAATPSFGATPLGVALSSDGSSDPEGLPLEFSWDFGDGSAAGTVADPIHAYFGPVGVPTTYTATLTVRDASGQTAVAQTTVAVNDTPPQVSITSPMSQGLYAMDAPAVYPLSADISDAEQGASQLTCAWQVLLHHNTHVHPEPIDTRCSTSAVVSPVGCDGNTYYYTFALTVNDGAGLSATREVALYPDCASVLPAICGNLDASALRNLSDVLRLRAALANPVSNGLSAGELARCSVTGGTECDVADLTVLRRYLVGFAPGPAPVCPAALP